MIPERRRECPAWLIAAGLCLLAVFAHEGVRRCGFLSHDDDLLVWRNPIVAQGITAPGLRWAFVADLLYDSRLSNYWTPLAVVSHMADVSLFGMSAPGHHLMNLFFHAANVGLAFFAFARLTRSRWCGAFVAAVLAVHPVHVESVAWVSERKDVLSGTFAFLALLAYAAYVRRPGPARMAAVAFALALGLLAKPMLITLPFALLLLDLWPLGRGPLRARLVLEKWPLFVLVLASVAATFVSNLNGRSLDALPLGARLANAVSAYVAYLGAILWPSGLAVAYPHVGTSISPARLAASAALLIALSATAFHERRRRPYLLVGWCWFLGTLLPAMGIVVQSGSQGRADRFLYLPLLGLSLATAALVAERVTTPGRARIVACAAVLTLAVLTAVTRHQVAYWTDDLTVFRHAVEVSPTSEVAHAGLAWALAYSGDFDGAEREYRAALVCRPDFMWGRLALSALFEMRGRKAESVQVVADGIRAAPEKYSFESGLLAARQGRVEEAMGDYAQALARNPRHHAALYNWGNLLAARGQMSEAVEKYRAAARLDRDDSTIANNLALALLFSGHAPEALERLDAALVLDPHNALLRTSRGLTLSAGGRHVEALAELAEAVRLDPRSTDARDALDAERRRP